MDIRQFEYVLSITQYKSISKAAESLHVSQPTLSQFLSRLEKELGTSLFWRTRNGFIPTEAGKEYLQGAQAILDITRNISGKIEKLKERKNNRIVVGLSHGRSAQFFSK